MLILDGDVQKLEERAISHRRWLHQYPEIGFDVYGTKDYILKT